MDLLSNCGAKLHVNVQTKAVFCPTKATSCCPRRGSCTKATSSCRQKAGLFSPMLDYVYRWADSLLFYFSIQEVILDGCPQRWGTLLQFYGTNHLQIMLEWWQNHPQIMSAAMGGQSASNPPQTTPLEICIRLISTPNTSKLHKKQAQNYITQPSII